MGFFTNPVNYLVSRGGPGVDEILFVPPSPPNGPDFPDEAIEGIDDDGPLPLRFEEGKPPSLEDPNLGGTPRQSMPKVTHLKAGGGLCIPGFWEFVPYNFVVENDLDTTFYEEVCTEKSALLTASTNQDRQDALARLKKIYEAKFRSSRKRNEISLFLYAGPVHSRGEANFMPPYLNSNRCSILYSGDGFLDSSELADRLIAYLGRRRMERVGVFQVMHHGSKHNWFPGLASQIAPEFSVFSAGGITHPHREVVDDFKLHWPVNVRKGRSATFGGFIHFP